MWVLQKYEYNKYKKYKDPSFFREKGHEKIKQWTTRNQTLYQGHCFGDLKSLGHTHWQGYLVAIIHLKQVKISSVINFTLSQNQSMVKI